MSNEQTIACPFEFTDPSDNDGAAVGSFVLDVPPGIQSKAELLGTLASAGRFPEYFGNNWDALLDCLRDFGWIREKQIVISHIDVPLRTHPNECRIYLEMLRDAHLDWARSKGTAGNVPPEHELRIRFPRSEQSFVLQILSS